MHTDNPHLKWYVGIREKQALQPRRPFATSERCPRYYQTLSLLEHAGATEIPKERDEQLKKFWEKTDLWPLTREQETSLSGSNKWMFNNFCPEVAAQHTGYFASSLIPWHDEEERENYYKRALPG